MKFHQLAIGTRFIANDKAHTKINNVMALDETTKSQVFMKRSADVFILEGTNNTPAQSEPKSAAILAEALLNFQNACIKQFKSYQDGVSMDMIEAEITNIRNEILQHYRKKIDL